MRAAAVFPFLRMVLSGVLTLLVLGFLAIAGLVAYVQTDGGLRFLERNIARYGHFGGMSLRVSLQSFSPWHIAAPLVEISDAEGVMISARDIDLRINAQTFVLFRPVVDSLTVAEMDIRRLPDAAAAAEEEAKTDTAEMPDVNATIRRAEIARIVVGAGIYGVEEVFSLKSHLTLSSRLQDNRVDILLAGAEAAQTHFRALFVPDGDGRLNASLLLKDRAGGIVTRLMGLPAGYDVFARLDGTGPAENWTGDAHIKLGRELQGDFNLTYVGRHLSVTADLKGPRGVYVKGDARLPLIFDPPYIPPRAPLSARFSTTLNLQSLTLLLGLDEHRMTGNLVLNAVVSGTRASPVVTGTGVLKNGSYANLPLETQLTHINAHIAGDGRDIRLENLSARTPRGGTISGRGAMSLADIANPVYTARIDLNRAQVTGMQLATVTVTGGLDIRGDMNRTDIAGKILVNNAEVYLAGFGSGSAARMLNIQEINVPKHLRRSRRVPPAVSHNIGLDIAVDAPRAVFVRGQGLDTEWSAAVNIAGDAAAPDMAGQLRMIRGRYEFFDALLTLDSGLIDFKDGAADNPALDIKGRIKGKQVTANVAVAGRAMSPDVTLTSTPPLPQDEIFSRVFFNKDVTQLTPMEMVRIAQIVAMISGHGPDGPDPISRLRKTVGIDMFSINTDDKTGAASVSVGKYIGDGIYVSVDQGMTTQSSAIKLEMELTPSIQVETRVDSNSDNSVGINWKRDY